MFSYVRIYLANLIIPSNQIKCHLIVIFVAAKIMRILPKIIFSILLAILSGCVGTEHGLFPNGTEYAVCFDLVQNDSITGVVTIAPEAALSDTLWIDRPMDRIICMSSSHVAALSAIDAIQTVKGVSGIRYISDPTIDREAVTDVGYDAALDYESVLRLDPDLLVTYAVNGTEPAYVSKLRSLGVRTLVLHDHLEHHPLARAEYVRLFGALTGHQHVADSVFAEIRDSYLDLAASVCEEDPVKVLINIPYGDAWYIPGQEGYMSRLVEDAGGVILGAASGATASSVISMEKAYGYSLEADMWLNPGSCKSREELARVHHMFSRFGPIANGLPIYNNIRCVNEAGGNDFWERGAIRPDLILHDLICIMKQARGETKEDSPQENLLFHIAL